MIAEANTEPENLLSEPGAFEYRQDALWFFGPAAVAPDTFRPGSNSQPPL
jgi:hypothetical protein